MSIKTKAPLMVAGILLINFAALIVYIMVFLPERLANLIERTTGVTISMETLLNNRFVSSVFLFEIIVFLLFAVISTFIVYLYYARPLVNLNATVSNPKSLSAISKTTRKDEIGQLQNSFADLSEQLQEEKWNQDRMIAGISHDIKTPLTSIAGYSETLLKKELPKNQIDRYLAAIFSSAQRIEQIVEEFDLYVEGRLPFTLEKKEYKIAFLMEMLKEEYEEDLRSQQIQLLLHNTCPVDRKICCDLPKLRRVFANLISNAIKHNKNASAFVIQVDMSIDKEQLLVLVRDNGYGVKENDLSHIFEPFYTSDADRQRHGLGLSICKDIIEAHAGWIDAQNVDGGGFKVCFALPIDASTKSGPKIIT